MKTLRTKKKAGKNFYLSNFWNSKLAVSATHKVKGGDDSPVFHEDEAYDIIIEEIIDI